MTALPAGVVTVIPLRDGPWRIVVLDRVVPCQTRGCQRHPHARFRWYDTTTGDVRCGVCRFGITGRTPERHEPTPVRADDELDGQLTIEVLK